MPITGFVYRIVCFDAELGKKKVYVGSTAYPLHVRLGQHKQHLESYKEGKHNYVASFEVIRSSSYQMELEEQIEFEHVSQLVQAERRAYDKYKADPEYIVVNVNVPGRSAREYYQSDDGKETLKRYQQTEKGKKAVAKANKKYYEKRKAEKAAAMAAAIAAAQQANQTAQPSQTQTNASTTANTDLINVITTSTEFTDI